VTACTEDLPGLLSTVTDRRWRFSAFTRVAVCWKRDGDLGPARAFSSVVEEAEQFDSLAIG
jgi:hypothetical protein